MYCVPRIRIMPGIKLSIVMYCDPGITEDREMFLDVLDYVVATREAEE